MANPSVPTYPVTGNVVPRSTFPLRPEDIVYPGQPSNPQHNFNRMLQGPVHAGSSLPSEQLAPQNGDFQQMQALRQQFQQEQRAKAPTPMANVTPQQQLAFAAPNNPGVRMHTGLPGYPSQPNWPMGLQRDHNPGTSGGPGPSGMGIAGFQQGLQNNPSFQNGRPMQPGQVPPSAAAFVFRNNAAQQMNHGQMNAAIRPPTPQQQPPQNQGGNPLGDSDAFQMSLPGFPPGVSRYPSLNGTRLSQSPLPGQPFVASAGRPPLHQSTDSSTNQSPSRSANNTPGSIPPALSDYRDAMQIQMQNLRTQSVPPQPQAVQLQPAPGTHPALLPPSHLHHPQDAAFRQQQMLMQRQNHATQLGRAQFAAAQAPGGIPPSASAPPSLLRNASAPALPTVQMHSAFPPPPTQTPHIQASQPSSSPGFSNPQSGSQPPQSRPASTVAPMELNPSHSPAISNAGSGPMDIAPPPPPIMNGPTESVPNNSNSTQMAFSRSETKLPSPIPPNSFSDGMKRVLDFCTAVTKMQQIKATAKTWVSFAHAFLQPTATFDMTLWSTTENHSRIFRMDPGMMGRFFHRTFNAGVRSLEITIQSPTESRENGVLKINVQATWIYTYEAGYIVILPGPLEFIFNTEPVENGDWLFSHMAFASVDYLKTLPVNQVRSMIAAANGQGRPTTSSSSRASPSFTDGSATSTAVEHGNDDEGQEFNGIMFPKDPVSPYGVPSLVIPCLDLGEGWNDAGMVPMINIAHPNNGPMSSLSFIAQKMLEGHPELRDEVQKRDAALRKPQAPPTPMNATPQQAHTSTPKVTATRDPTASPMQDIERSIPTPSGSRPKPSTKQTRSVAPKPTPQSDNLSDSSLSSPPMTSKRKAEEEPEPSLSPTDPAPSRRKTHTSSAASDVSSSLSTRSTTRQQQQRKQSSPKLTARPRRRGT